MSNTSSRKARGERPRINTAVVAAPVEAPKTDNHLFQTRVPREIFNRLEAVLESKYAPMKPPSLNSVVLYGLELVMERIIAEQAGGQVKKN